MWVFVTNTPLFLKDITSVEELREIQSDLRATKVNAPVRTAISDTGALLYGKSTRGESGSLDDEESLFRRPGKRSVAIY